VELRELEAFVMVASELHFGRAAERLHVGRATVTELVQRLEHELGFTLLARTTRTVALTPAGAVLFARSARILADLADAADQARRAAHGEFGTVRLGITPPVAPSLAPHLISEFASAAPGVAVETQQMWLTDLVEATASGQVDVAITCGRLSGRDRLATEILCAEPLYVGVRPSHRLAGEESVNLADLAGERLGSPRRGLFPAWSMTQRQLLSHAHLDPPTVEFLGADLAAARWAEQPCIDWIMLISSMIAAHDATVVLPVDPPVRVPYTMLWNAERARDNTIARFVAAAIEMPPPCGWSGHLPRPEPGGRPAAPPTAGA
jgi:DNA-binding transcriptional LysR family regulator